MADLVNNSRKCSDLGQPDPIKKKIKNFYIRKK